MNKQHRTNNALLASALSAALLLGFSGNAAAEKKIHICHLPPGNPENVQLVSISLNAQNTHEDHHGDYPAKLMEDGTHKCFPPDPVAVNPTTLDVLACINRPGKHIGRNISTSLSGKISSTRVGCELEL